MSAIVMNLQVGSFSFKTGEAGIKRDCKYQLDGKGEPWLKIEDWTIEAKFTKDRNNGLGVVSTYETLCEQPQNAIGLVRGGAPVGSDFVYASETIGGIRCIKPPSYLKYQGGELVTYRTVTSTWQFVKPLFQSPLQIIDFKETVPQVGAGRTIGALQPNYGPAVMQQLRQLKSSTLTQSGSVTYAGTYGPPPPPLFLNGQVGPVELTRNPPQRIGSGAYVGYVGFTIDYQYQYESPYTLNALPTAWI